MVPATLAVAFCLALAACGGAKGPEGAAGNGRGRVLLIGIDGATWDLITPLSREGKLPNLTRLIETGSSGPLRSFNPTASPTIWTTIATGRTPEEHGILGFVKNLDSGAQRSYTSEDRRVRAIWNILSERRRPVSIVGWFTSWPADIVQGAFISDRCEGPLPGGFHPASLAPLLEKTSSAGASSAPVSALLGPPIEPLGVPEEERRAYRRIETQLESYGRVDALRLEWTLRLMRDQSADLTAVFFKGIDPCSHLTWAFMDPGAFHGAFTPRREAVARFGRVIPGYYAFMDAAVGRLVAAAAGADVIVVSDHGFGPSLNALGYHINPVLARLGWLETQAEGRPDPVRSLVIDPTPEGKGGWRKRRLVVNRHILEQRAPTEEEKESLVEALRGTLRSLRTTAGEALFRSVEMAGGAPPPQEDDAAGENAIPVAEAGRFALDVEVNDSFQGVRRTDEGIRISGSYLANGREFPLGDLLSVRRDHTGTHRIEGVLVLAGPRILQGARVRGATVYDIMPTMLRLLGLPVARDMRGRILDQALRSDRLPPRPEPVASYERPDPIPRLAAPALPEIEEELQQRLKTLGYVQ